MMPPPASPGELRAKRVSATVLAAVAAVQGGWAGLAPLSFYDSFPGGGHHWVSMLGPYDEHLVRDVGVLQLAMLVMTAWAAVRPKSETFALVGAGWFTFGLPHLVFHLFHLSGMSTVDKAANVINLGGTVVLAIVLVLPLSAFRRRRRRASDH